MLNSSDAHEQMSYTPVVNKYLQSKFVKAEVDEVLDTGQDAMIQVLPCDALEDDAKGWRLKVVMETEVELMAMDSSLEHQESQHHQMVLQHRKKLNWDKIQRSNYLETSHNSISHMNSGQCPDNV